MPSTSHKPSVGMITSANNIFCSNPDEPKTVKRCNISAVSNHYFPVSK